MSRFFEEQNGNENDSKIACPQKHGAAQSRESASQRAGENCSSKASGD